MYHPNGLPPRAPYPQPQHGPYRPAGQVMAGGVPVWSPSAQPPPVKRPRLADSPWRGPTPMTAPPLSSPEPEKIMVGPYPLPFSPEEIERMDAKQIFEVATTLRALHTSCSQDIEVRQSQHQRPLPGSELKRLLQTKKAIEQAYALLTEAHTRKKALVVNPAAAHTQEQTQTQPQPPQTTDQPPAPTVEEPPPEEEEEKTMQQSRVKPSGTDDIIDPVISKKKLQELATQIDPNIVLTEEVEDLLIIFAEEFVEDLAKYSCVLSKHRKAPCIDAQDVVVHIGVNWNMQVAGFAPETSKARQGSTQGHRNRLANVQKAAASNSNRR